MLRSTFVLIWGYLLFHAANSYAQAFYQLHTPCNPIAVKTCAMPVPSDIYALEDSSSPTGMRLFYPDGIARQELLSVLPSSLMPDRVINGSTGYSAATSVSFELPQAPNLLTLPIDGGESVVAFNLKTGERVPVRAQISEYARSKRVSEPSQIIEIYPRARWSFGERHVVFVTKTLKAADGKDLAPSSGFLQAISQDGSPLSEYYEPIIQFIETKGYSRHELLSATFFTIRDEHEVTDGLARLSAHVYQQEHPLRNLKIRHKLFGPVGAHVSGEVLVHNFRDEQGSMIYDTNQARQNWVRFRMTLPRTASKNAAPVAIFGHGIGFIKESGFDTAVNNAKMGIATIGIDHPNHGSRISADGGWVGFLMNTDDVPRQVGMMNQISIDQMSLLKAVRTSIGNLDILPRQKRSPLVTTDTNRGDGKPDLDTSRVYYHGVSLGGVLGSAFVALAPDLKGTVLTVTGTGVTNILSGSALWDPFFSRMVPKIATGAEALLLKTAMQHVLDYGDAINFIHQFRNPVGMATPKPVMIVAVDGDQIVPNFSTVAYAEIADLPLVGDQLFDLHTQHQLHFTDGYGVIQLPAITRTGNARLDGFMGHFTSERANQQVNDWIRQYVLQ